MEVATMGDMHTQQRVDAVRSFNRYYTKQIGVLREGLLGSPYSLTEVRVLYELAHRSQPTAAELGRELGLDAGYLSRILRNFERRGLVAKARSKADGRRSLLSLTARGRKAFAPLNARSHDEVAAMLARLSATEQGRLIEAMRTIQALLGGRAEPKVPYVLRSHRPGDMGWIIHRHGALYAQEYGWDETFEALVAEIAAKFIRNLDPKCERCWIAEREGEIVGSVFLVQKSKTVGQLRLMYVEPKARGLGIGSRLVEECLQFARQVGYRKVVLWTNSVLLAARHIYEKAGFRLIHSEPHRSFGRDLVGETWELTIV
jgi:DNA-binding MarR family transcriptional regulator/N-acetylglutamate synthase-like GNAT family acetyltransferase